MTSFVQRHFFMALAALGLLGMIGFVVIKEIVPKGEQGGPPGGGGGGPPGAGASKGSPPGGGGGRRAANVVVQPAALRDFTNRTDVLGTVIANESVTISSKTQDVIERVAFESGQFVRKGDVLIVLSSVEQKADLLQARARLVQAEATYKRFSELLEKGFAPRSRVDEALAARDSAKAAVQGLESRIADRIIRAPFSGTIGLRNVSEGALARPGDVLATLDDTSQVKIDIDIPETALDSVRVGSTVALRIQGADEGRVLAQISTLDTRLNAASRTLRGRAIIRNPDGALKPGMLVSGVIESGSRRAVAVPEVALTDELQQAFVFIAKPGAEGSATAERVPVELGARIDGFAEVRSGLQPGAPVIVEGIVRLQPGQPVRMAGSGPPSSGGAGGRPSGGPPQGAPSAQPNAPPPKAG